MYSAPQLIIKYLKHRIIASSGKGHGMHSPFVFQFITRVLNDRTVYPEYVKVEKLRAELLADHSVLHVEDMGAGSSTAARTRRSVSSIARHAAKSRKLGQLLFRIARYYQPRTILELGTSLGISSAYLASANPGTALITLEGAGEIAARASSNFRKLGLENIRLVTGNFDETLSGVLGGLPSPDLVFIDGNHRREPTERYFRELLPLVHHHSILIFDDIHWSREMETAWKTIRDHPSVRATIDLFFMGIVLFRQEFREKQHFSIRH